MFYFALVFLVLCIFLVITNRKDVSTKYFIGMMLAYINALFFMMIYFAKDTSYNNVVGNYFSMPLAVWEFLMFLPLNREFLLCVWNLSYFLALYLGLNFAMSFYQYGEIQWMKISRTVISIVLLLEFLIYHPYVQKYGYYFLYPSILNIVEIEKMQELLYLLTKGINAGILLFGVGILISNYRKITPLKMIRRNMLFLMLNYIMIISMCQAILGRYPAFLMKVSRIADIVIFRSLEVNDSRLLHEKLYLYWGLGTDGIYGMEMDAACPFKGIGPVKSLIPFREKNEWERLGAWNQNRGLSFVEGAWMHKHDGTYYLIYSAPGTCYSTYAWGVCRSKSPLEGFEYQKNNPVLLKRHGLVTGTGHGSLAEGPGNTLWAFYTIKLCYATKYERRIAMDPAGFDEEGNLFVKEPSEIPQWAPGIVSSPELCGDTPLLPLTFEEQAVVSSHAPGRDGLYALDNSMLTWWQPADEDENGQLMVDLRAVFKVSGARIIWRDVNLDYENGILPGAFQYVIQVCDGERPDHFTTALDCSENRTDYAVDYRTFETVSARYVRLILKGGPKGIRPGVISFTVFGEYERG